MKYIQITKSNIDEIIRIMSVHGENTVPITVGKSQIVFLPTNHPEYYSSIDNVIILDRVPANENC